MRLKLLIKYKVKKRDNLYNIARKHGIKWKEDIYDLPVNSEFRHLFPEPHKIDYIFNGNPVFVYVLTHVEWDEEIVKKFVRKFLPPYWFQKNDNIKGHARTSNEREIGIIKTENYNICARYEIPYKGGVMLPPLGPMLQAWSWDFKLRVPAVLNSSGEIVFDQANINANNTISITKEAEGVGLSVFGHLTASFGLEGLFKLGLSGLAGQGISLSAMGELTYTLEREIAGQKYKVHFTLRTDIDYLRHGYLKVGFEYAGSEKIYCGIQDGSWIAVEWKFADPAFAEAARLVPTDVYSLQYQGYHILAIELEHIPNIGSAQRIFQRANQLTTVFVLQSILILCGREIAVPLPKPVPIPIR